MRAILIDPYARTVREVVTSGATRPDAGGRPSIYTAMSGPEHTVELFTVLDLGHGETLYLDDEGLLQPGRAIFRLKGYPEPLAGRGLILGTDDEGGSKDSALTVKHVAGLITWTDHETSGDVGAGHEGVVEGPDGKPWPAWIGGKAVLQPLGSHAAERQGRDVAD